MALLPLFKQFLQLCAAVITHSLASPFFILLYHPEPTSSTKVMSAFWVMHPAKIGIKRGENMAEKAILEIPDGYKIEEKSYIVDRETAF